MKLAHSNLLGEYVDATEVEHADTTGFQIVCPCCAESVFKVVRPLGDGNRSEFFSHRKAPPLQVAECELRVGGIPREQRIASNEEARGQTLALFREWMRSALSLERWCYAGRSPSDTHKRMSAMTEGVNVFELFRKDQVRLGADDVVSDELQQVRLGFENIGVPLPSTFNRTIHERIVGDMLRHLLTPEGKANHAYLFRHTVLRMHTVDGILRNLQGTQRTNPTPMPDDVSLMLRACVTKNTRMARAYLDESQRRFDPADSDRFYRMVTMGMLTDLWRIPYAEMLTNHRAGRRPLEGVIARERPDALGGIRYRIAGANA